MTYTISIATGNRWGAETEADLFIQLIGDEQTSKKFTLKQDLVCLDGLVTGRRASISSATDGLVSRAGIFIDYILITENTMEGRQFVCYCSKWFDSGQVKILLFRLDYSITLTFHIFIVGRWEFILHNGMEDGIGGTTSNLIVIGYGTAGSSMMRVENDKTMQKVPDTTLIQVDFGEIGELLKVRFEIDGAGDKPDYYLEWIELRDLDTEERLAISLSYAGILVQSYEGKVIGGNTKLLSDNILHAQLIGDYSDSGIFPLIYNENKKVMAVSATVRESTHSPYRYVLKEGKFKELTEDRPYFKVLSFTGSSLSI
uniref:PLAT domain-containing protein n=1 Tax=Heterorhabditis bacteriophora TaxID=37862 RepID=A0A1I7X1K7_HETBA